MDRVNLYNLPCSGFFSGGCCVSVRSFKRAHARRQAREQRRASTLRHKGGLIAGLAMSSATLMVANAQAATYTVTTNGDDAAGGTCGSTCTLRDAISQASSGTTADTITFAPNLTSPITLVPANGALSITNGGGLTITGPGASALAVSGGGATQVINNSASGTVTITGLTIEDGNSGSTNGGPWTTRLGTAWC